MFAIILIVLYDCYSLIQCLNCAQTGHEEMSETAVWSAMASRYANK